MCADANLATPAGRTVPVYVYLEDGVLLFARGRVACCVFPRDLEEPLVGADPAQTRVHAAVHLRQQPRL